MILSQNDRSDRMPAGAAEAIRVRIPRARAGGAILGSSDSLLEQITASGDPCHCNLCMLGQPG
jgi:hypothetical protein